MENKCQNVHAYGRVISLMEILHVMLNYPDVKTDMNSFQIPTTLLELCPVIYLYFRYAHGLSM